MVTCLPFELITDSDNPQPPNPPTLVRALHGHGARSISKRHRVVLRLHLGWLECLAREMWKILDNPRNHRENEWTWFIHAGFSGSWFYWRENGNRVLSNGFPFSIRLTSRDGDPIQQSVDCAGSTGSENLERPNPMVYNSISNLKMVINWGISWYFPFWDIYWLGFLYGDFLAITIL